MSKGVCRVCRKESDLTIRRMCAVCDEKDMAAFIMWNQKMLDADVAYHEEELEDG
jgi:hypothetical protein